MTTKTTDQINDNLIKDNLYDAVNGQWFKTAIIPDDHASTGGFMDLNDNIDKLLMADTEQLVSDSETLSGSLLEYTKLYQKALDFDTRNHQGNAPLKPYLKKIEALNSFEDLNANIKDLIVGGYALPFSLSVSPDMKNTRANALYADVPGLFLPDRPYYEDNNPAYDQLMPAFTDMAVKLMQMADYSEEQAEQLVADAKAFDALIAPNVKSAEESADYSKMYNPHSYADFADYSDTFDFNHLATALLGKVPEQIIVTEPEYYRHFNEIVNAATFKYLKAWMLVKWVLKSTAYLSEDFRQAGSAYSRILSGKKATTAPKKSAFYLASGLFSQTLGDYYAKKYFGPKAKQDVEHMVQTMITVYKDRLQNNTWLGADTKQKAILKLDKLELLVGYPDKIDPLELKFKVSDDSLLANLISFMQIAIQEAFSKLDQPVDRSKWEMSAATVNAYYAPFKNIIVFPAAILQAPFYSLEQSASENYGGIGAVIAHEISHAFDNNGALFDEYGNLNNWWSESDNKIFNELADQMIAQFDGLTTTAGTVNGKLTVSENIADAGGLSCANEAAQKDADYNGYQFFTNWAKIWRMKATPEYRQLLLNIDVHAPAEVRANQQVKNMDEFYNTFAINPTDKMYLEPSQRIHIW